MRIIDISMDLQRGMLNYDPDPCFEREVLSTASASDPDCYGLSLLRMSSHAGTHVDAPRHFRLDGAGIDQVPLDVLCGPARVLDLRGAGRVITADVLKGKAFKGQERVLLRTDMSDRLRSPFEQDHTHVSLDGAAFLRGRGVRLVGIDYLSIETYPSPGFPVHHELLCKEPPVIVIEGLDLHDAEEGDYDLFCLPLRVVGCDGAPARAILTCA